MASAGIARTIYPSFTPFDGDGIFAFCPEREGKVEGALLAYLGSEAAGVVAQSVSRAVRASHSA